MAELQKMISEQSVNGSANSDLMKAFVAKNRSSHDKPEQPKTSPGKGGASIFANTPTTTATTTTTTGGTDTTDNANILKALPDNHQHININTKDANNTTTTTTTTTSTTTNNHVDNRNKKAGATPTATTNANLNAANRKASPANANVKQVASPDSPDPNANVSEVAAVLQEVRGAMSEQRQQLVSQVTESAVDAHLATCINTHKAVAEARERFAQMKASGMLPDMSKLSLSAGSMWEKMMDQMMPEMNKTMTFFKALPGFSELGQGDQMKLIKSGMFEVMMTRFAMLIDHEEETMLDPSHKMVTPRHVVKAMPMGEFLDGFFHVGQQFNPLGLSDRQVALFTAVLALSPSRPGLSDVQLVSRLQSLYQQALYCALKDDHSDPDSKLSQALALVPMFRRMSEDHSKALGSMKSQSPDAFSKQFPPVHREIYAQSQ